MAEGTSSAPGARRFGGARVDAGTLAVVVGALVGLLALALAPAANAASSFTWSGVSSVSAGWSTASNWVGGEAPTASSTLEKLEFPLLTSEACESDPLHHPCYISENDLSGLTAESLQMDASAEYLILGNALTLGSGGLSAAPSMEPHEAFSLLLTPLVLGAAQTWNIAGFGTSTSIGENQLDVAGGMTGASHALNIDISKGGGVDLEEDNEVGPVTFEGAVSGQTGGNGLVGLFGARLNATDGNTVSVNHVFLYGAGRVGPLSTSGASLYLAVGGEPPDGTLEAASATLDAASRLTFEIANTSNLPGRDYARLISHGSVALGGAEVRVAGPASCATLPPGRTYTLVSTTGQLEGAFGNAPQGSEIAIAFPAKCGSVFQKMRLAYSESGATQTVVGTVIAGPTSSTALSASPGAASTNRGVKLTASVTASSGTASGAVEFQNDGAAIAGCSFQPVSAGIATCETSFQAANSPEHLTALFTPASGINLGSSSSETEDLSVARDSTTTTLQASNATPTMGESVAYTAIATPADVGASVPTGTIEFLDGNAPIGSCASQPLARSGASASATCQVSYAVPGTHSITARYAGDANFAGSSAAPGTNVAVVSPPPVAGSSGPPASGSSPAAQQVAGTSTGSGEVRLVSGALATQGGVVLVKLHCTAPGGCRGTLGLSAQSATRAGRGRRRGTISLGSAGFAVGAGGSATVKIKLSAAARALLHTAHGQLSASLRIAEVATGREATQLKSVHVLETAGAKGKHRRGHG